MVQKHMKKCHFARQNPINGVESMGNIKVTAPAKPSKCLDEDSSDDDKCHVANGGVCED